MIFITGISGSGKTTLATFLSKKYKLPYLSTGDFVRDVIYIGGEDYLECQKALEKGKLAPIEDRIRTYVLNAHDNSVIDGFPRSGDQLEWIYEHWENPTIIVLGVGRDTAKERLTQRGRETEELICEIIDQQELDFIDMSKVKIFNAEKTPVELRKEVDKWLQKIMK